MQGIRCCFLKILLTRMSFAHCHKIYLLPCALQKKNENSNRYFRWEDKETFSTTVTVDKLLQMRNKYNPAVYGAIAAYYNLADQYLRRNVQYAKLTLDAQ